MDYLKDLKGIEEEPYNKFTVIMGSPGSGKTTLAGTYPKPMLYVAIGNDGGSVVLKHYGDKDIKLLNLTSSGKHVGVKVKELLKELKDTMHGFKTILIDAYSSIEEEVVQWLELTNGKKLTQNEWGGVGKFMLGIRDDIVDLSRVGDVEMVLVTHIKTTDNNDTLTGEASKQIIPKMTVNNGRILLERASNVVYCARKTVTEDDGLTGVKWLTYIGAHPNMDTKLRTEGQQLPSGIYVENCTFEDIEHIKNGGLKNTKVINVVEPEIPEDIKDIVDEIEEW